MVRSNNVIMTIDGLFVEETWAGEVGDVDEQMELIQVREGRSRCIGVGYVIG